MAWQLVKKGDKYRIWSTVTDSYITTNFVDKEAIFKIIFWNKFENLMREMVEEMFCFPGGWSTKTGERLESDPEKYDEYCKVILARERNSLYDAFFAKIKEAGIVIDMKDDDGVRVGNTKAAKSA